MLRHLPDLENAGVVAHGTDPKVIMPMFTVPKKDEHLRLIMDCRRLNQGFAPPPSMDLPRIHDVVDYILDHEMAAQADGRSYFYQFPLSKEVGRYFGSVLGEARGRMETVALTVMPMGWSWAPALAQRSSNVLIKDCGIAWVDNFVVCGHDRKEFRTRRKRFLGRTHAARVELDDETLRPSDKLEALGIEFDLGRKRFRMAEEWSKRTSERISGWLQERDMTFAEFYAMAGSLLWRIHVTKRELCHSPEMIAMMSEIGQQVSAGTPWTARCVLGKELRRELLDANRELAINEWQQRQKYSPPTMEIWSDASDHFWTFLCFEEGKLVEAKRGRVKEGNHIFFSELSAALGGVMTGLRRGHSHVLCMIDNIAAAYALRRGASSNRKANEWLRAVTHAKRSVIWVESAAQIADEFTRPEASGALPPLPHMGTSVETLINKATKREKGIHQDEKRSIQLH
eukprot:PhM_4_TR18660/c3_g2_i2/m.19851